MSNPEKPKLAPVIHERPKMPARTWSALRSHIIAERRKKQEEEERLRLEKLRLGEERKMVKVEKTEMPQKIESHSNLEELRRLEELKLLERQRLEQMIYQGK